MHNSKKPLHNFTHIYKTLQNFTQVHKQLHKTLQHFTEFHTTFTKTTKIQQFTELFYKLYKTNKQFKTLHTFTQLFENKKTSHKRKDFEHTTLHDSTNFVKHFTQLYSTLQHERQINFTRLYNTFCKTYKTLQTSKLYTTFFFLQLYKLVQILTKTFQNYTRLYKTLQNSSHLYTFLHNYAQFTKPHKT